MGNTKTCLHSKGTNLVKESGHITNKMTNKAGPREEREVGPRVHVDMKHSPSHVVTGTR